VGKCFETARIQVLVNNNEERNLVEDKDRKNYVVCFKGKVDPVLFI
jgi:hypothetical protein